MQDQNLRFEGLLGTTLAKSLREAGYGGVIVLRTGSLIMSTSGETLMSLLGDGMETTLDHVLIKGEQSFNAEVHLSSLTLTLVHDPDLDPLTMHDPVSSPHTNGKG